VCDYEMKTRQWKMIEMKNKSHTQTHTHTLAHAAEKQKQKHMTRNKKKKKQRASTCCGHERRRAQNTYSIDYFIDGIHN